MSLRKIFVILLFVLNPYLYCQYNFKHIISDDSIFAVIGDTQAPTWIEKVFYKPSKNVQATNLLLNNINSLKIKKLIMLGDVTSYGSSESNWKDIDIQLGNAKRNNSEWYSIRGNHDYLITSKQAKDNFKKRFNNSSEYYFTFKIGSSILFLLNSNFSRYSESLLKIIKDSLEANVRSAQNDNNIHAIIFACHHPCFTNSKVASPDREVQKNFIHIFQKYSKCKLFLSGHAHNFEHILVDGKNYIVSGGGGGLRHPLKDKLNSLYKDLCPIDIGQRNFHYLLFKSSKDKLEVSLEMLQSNNKIDEVYKFIIK